MMIWPRKIYVCFRFPHLFFPGTLKDVIGIPEKKHAQPTLLQFSAIMDSCETYRERPYFKVQIELYTAFLTYSYLTFLLGISLLK